MSQPAPPTPGAPASTPTPAPPPAAPTATPTAPAPAAAQPPAATPAAPASPAPAAIPPWERDGQTFDAERAWNLVQSLRGEVNTLKAGRQSDAQAHGQLTEKMKQLLGLGPETTDPATLAQRVEAAQDAAWKSSVELQLYKIAGTLGANADALLDSVAFLNSVDDIDEQDPNSPAFRTALEAKVQEALTANPHYRTGQAPGAPAAPRFAAGADGGPRAGTTVPQITEAQLARMSPEQIVAAQEAGQLNDLLGIK